MEFCLATLCGRIVRNDHRAGPRIPSQGCGFPDPFSGGAGQRADDGRVAIRFRRAARCARRPAFRSGAHCGPGGQRHRFHRRRNDHPASSAGARADHRGEPLGYGRNRFGGRRPHVCVGRSRNGADAVRTRGVDPIFRRAGSQAHPPRLFVGPSCGGRGHVRQVEDFQVYGYLLRSRSPEDRRRSALPRNARDPGQRGGGRERVRRSPARDARHHGRADRLSIRMAAAGWSRVRTSGKPRSVPCPSPCRWDWFPERSRGFPRPVLRTTRSRTAASNRRPL